MPRSAVKTGLHVRVGRGDVDREQWTVGGGTKAIDIWTGTHASVLISPRAIWPGPWSPANPLAAAVSPQWPRSLLSRGDAVLCPCHLCGLVRSTEYG
jgi:hypothetical protein